MRRSGGWYWAATVAVVAFGVVSVFSVGWLFLTAGMVMTVAGFTGWATSRPTIFWPVVAGIAAFFVGYIAVAPWSCRAMATSGDDLGGNTVCDSVLGVTYEGAGNYNPPRWPGVAAGVAVAAAVGATTGLITGRRQPPQGPRSIAVQKASGEGSMGQRPPMTLTATVLDAPDARSLADFYHRLLGWPVGTDEPDWVTLRPHNGGTGLSFQTEAAYARPAWPAGPGEQQMMLHLDVEVADLDAAGAHALAEGAVLADYQPQEDVRVYLDPAGHPFCLWQG